MLCMRPNWKVPFIAGLFFALSIRLLAAPMMPEQVPVKQLNQEEAAEALFCFQNQHPEKDIAFQFSLEPRGSQYRNPGYDGLMYVSWRPQLLARIELWPEKKSQVEKPAFVFFIEQGPMPRMWSLSEERGVFPIEPKDWLMPLFPNLPYTAFDFLMPFTHWSAKYISSDRNTGRVVHHYQMIPPQRLIDAGLPLCSVHLVIDGSFYTLTKAELLDEKAKPIRALKVDSFKKVQDQWMVKTIDLSLPESKTKARLFLKAAATELDLPKDLFSAQALEKPLPLVEAKRYQSL